MIDDVLDTLLFKLEGRVMHKGDEAIAIAFAPNPDGRPTPQGRLAQKFTGTMWVRETDAEVMHVEAHSVDNILVGLGIVARLNKETTATLIGRQVPGGVWMPTEFTLSSRGRAALFRRLVVAYSIGWLDYAPIDEPFKLPPSASP